MNLLIENLFKQQLFNSKISVFLATMFSVLIIGLLGLMSINYNYIKKTLRESVSFSLIIDGRSKLSFKKKIL